VPTRDVIRSATRPVRHAYKIVHGLANIKADVHCLVERHAIAFHALKDVPKNSPAVTNVRAPVARSAPRTTARHVLTSERAELICLK